MLVAMVTAPKFTGLGDDLRLLFMVFGVQHFVLDAAVFEHLGQQLALFNGNGAHQHRLAFAWHSTICSMTALNFAFSVL